MEKKYSSLKPSSGMKRRRTKEHYSSDSEMKERTSKRYKKKRHKRKSKSKLKKKKKLSSSDSSHSDSDSSTTGTSSEERKRKKRKKEKRKNKLKSNVSRKDTAESDRDDIEIGPLPPSSAMINRQVRGEVTDDITVGPLPPSNSKGNVKSMVPMTKDEWEKRQSVVKRVFDEDTGRWRLVKGDGEILEEIVSRDRHKEINRQATAGDGLYFQSKITDKMKRS